MLNKSNIYVKVDTPEKRKEAYRILTENFQVIGPGTMRSLISGELGNDRYILLNDDIKHMPMWSLCEVNRGLTEITLSELESMLKGEEERNEAVEFDMEKEELKFEVKQLRKLCIKLASYQNLDKDSDDNYQCSCGFICKNEDLDGGHPIADTGDYSEPCCPCCGKTTDY